jgi:hypothetical protein
MVSNTSALLALWLGAASGAACQPAMSLQSQDASASSASADAADLPNEAGDAPIGSSVDGAGQRGDTGTDASAEAKGDEHHEAYGSYVQFASGDGMAVCKSTPQPLGPETKDRKSVERYLCNGRAKCRIDNYVPLPAGQGSLRAVARLWLGKPFDPKLDDLDQTVHTEHWLVQAGPQERLTRRMLTRSDGFRGDQQHPGTPAGTLEIEGDIAHYKVRHVAASGRWYGWNEGTLSLDRVAC